MSVGHIFFIISIIGISVLISIVTSKGYMDRSFSNRRCEMDQLSETTILVRTIRDVHKIRSKLALRTFQQYVTDNPTRFIGKDSEHILMHHNNNKHKRQTNDDSVFEQRTKRQLNYNGPNKLPLVYIKKRKKTSDTQATVPLNEMSLESNRNLTRFLPQINKLQKIKDTLFRNASAIFQNHTVIKSVDKAEQRVIADMLSKEVRILCWLFDSVNEHLQNAAFVLQSWGMRCNVILFMTNDSTILPPLINLPHYNRSSFFNRPMKEAFKYVFNHHRDEADWFLMVDYSTFIVLENLRFMLLEYLSSNSIWLFNRILSRGGLDTFIWHAENNLFGCGYEEQGTDMLSCLEKIGVKMKGTTDERGCARYFDLSIFSLIGAAKSIRNRIEKLNIFKAYKECTSDKAFAFQLNSTNDIPKIDYMIYHARPYGMKHRPISTAGDYPLEELHYIRVSNWWRLFSKAYKTQVVSKNALYSNDSTALKLANDVRVLCWVLTYPKNHERKAAIIKATWGKRCNILLFMSSQYDSSLPTVVLPVQEGWNYIWGKTRAAFKYIYHHYRDEADWFLKVDDDTFVIVENLRYMLSSLNRSDPLYTGCWYKSSNPKENYMSGGAGYVLSREALDRFVNKAMTSPSLCSDTNLGAEDLNMGKCLANVGVKFLDSRDSLKRARFLPFPPTHHLLVGFLTNDKVPFYWNFIKYNISEGINCCSQFAISFHYVEPAEMHEFYYLLYDLHLFGVSYEDNYTQHNRTPHIPQKHKIIKEESKPQSVIDYIWTLVKLFM